MVCTKKNGTTKRYIFSRKGYYSSGGTSWTTSTQISALSGQSGWRYAYGNGLFIAGRNGNISTSTDGSTWTTPTTKINYTLIPNYSNYSLQKLLYLNNTFYAVYCVVGSGNNIYISSSSDGSTWTTPASTVYTSPIAGMAYGTTISSLVTLVMLDQIGRIFYFRNNSWQQVAETPLGNNSWADLIYDGEKFIALSSTGYISKATDGLTTWETPASLLGNHSWKAIIFNGEKYVALGSTGYISNSEDLSTWSTPTQDSNLGSHTWVNLVNNEKLYAFGNTGYMSDDGNAIKTKTYTLATKSNGTVTRYI